MDITQLCWMVLAITKADLLEAPRGSQIFSSWGFLSGRGVFKEFPSWSHIDTGIVPDLQSEAHTLPIKVTGIL